MPRPGRGGDSQWLGAQSQQQTLQFAGLGSSGTGGAQLLCPLFLTDTPPQDTGGHLQPGTHPPLPEALLTSLPPEHWREWADEDICYLPIPVSNELPSLQREPNSSSF